MQTRHRMTHRWDELPLAMAHGG